MKFISNLNLSGYIKQKYQIQTRKKKSSSSQFDFFSKLKCAGMDKGKNQGSSALQCKDFCSIKEKHCYLYCVLFKIFVFLHLI